MQDEHLINVDSLVAALSKFGQKLTRDNVQMLRFLASRDKDNLLNAKDLLNA